MPLLRITNVRKSGKCPSFPHHIAFQVEDIEKSIEELKTKGIQIVSDGIKKGIEGKRIAFLHPKSCHNVLIELTQKGEEA